MNSKKNRVALLFALAALFFPASLLNAQTTLKLATITPDNSPWNDTLYLMADTIAEKTDGRVEIKIFGNGLAGEERDVLRKMRLGSVDAGIFSALAMKIVVPETLVMTLPYLVKDLDELKKIMAEFTPEFNTKFNQQGYEVLGWAFSGWSYLFTKTPINSPSETSNIRLGVSPSEPELLAAWQAIGFQVTTISFSETFVSLQSGLLTGYYNTPLGALAYQWFAFTPNMLDSKAAPLLGGILVSQRSWRRISPTDQAIIKQEVARMIAQFEQVAIDQDNRALATMKSKGLQVITPSPAQEAAWIDAYKSKGYSKVIGGGSVPQELLDRALQIIQR